MIVKLSWEDIENKLREIRDYISKDDIIFGIPRGGLVVLGLFKMLYPEIKTTTDIKEATVILDDIIDSEKTVKRYQTINPHVRTYVLVNKKKNPSDDWIYFPWEDEDESKDIEDCLLRVMQVCGVDYEKIKPDRFLRDVKSFTSQYN